MSNYKTYLAANILTEQKIVTYRLLSRALKVHVNIAKEMLFDFHRLQNAKKPGTIHATYLIIGTRQDEEVSKLSNGADLDIIDDGFIQSSPFTCSPLSTSDESVTIPVKTITLVREADLEKIRSKYKHIDSIHIYSLGLYSVKDLQILSEATQRLNQHCSGEDPQKSCSTYGTIQNKYLKLRVQKRPGLAVSSSSIKTGPSTVENVGNNKNPVVESKAKPTSAQLSSKTTSTSVGKTKLGATSVPNQPEKSSVKQSTSKTLTSSKTQKLDKSSIFTAFARTESIQKHEKRKNYTSEKIAPGASEDFPMKDVFSDDDDDDNDNDEILASPLPEIKNTKINRKSKKEREEELKKMMEDDEEEEIKEQEEKEIEKESVKSLVSCGTDTTTSEAVAVAINEQTNINAGKKRRSRRRVMKKTTFKDDEGYLVTKEEPAWESFSEDEIPVPVSRPMVKNQQSTASKPKKGTMGKSSQGNIMSFFGKKS